MKAYRLPIIIISVVLLSVNANASSDPRSRIHSSDDFLREVQADISRERAEVSKELINSLDICLVPLGIYCLGLIPRMPTPLRCFAFATGALGTVHFLTKQATLTKQLRHLSSLEYRFWDRTIAKADAASAEHKELSAKVKKVLEEDNLIED